MLKGNKMREHKYRAKINCLKYGKLREGDWFYFNLRDLEYSGGIPVDWSTLSQYIGLKDKNKVEIYEKDILGREGNPNAVVCWHSKTNSIILGHFVKLGKDIRINFDTFEEYDIDCFWFCCEEDEIIGNAIDNPELLEK